MAEEDGRWHRRMEGDGRWQRGTKGSNGRTQVSAYAMLCELASEPRGIRTLQTARSISLMRRILSHSTSEM